jgi:nucleoside 2-deoxyribosyltransferase
MAMAFDREDTDAVFDRLIAPVVRTLTVAGERVGASPIRVDRVEHNDDIDDRIMSELSACDFVIADLTYARPSVYFEAGYAQARVPVVFTCRRDHFVPKTDDPHGNTRVHFDLQMRNIVPWRDARDNAFAEKLRRRLVHVLTPIVRTRAADAAETMAEAAFRRLSTVERAASMVSVAGEQLSTLRVPVADHHQVWRELRDSQVNRFEPDWVCGRLLERLRLALRDARVLMAVRQLRGEDFIESWTTLVSAAALPKRQLAVATDVYVNQPGYALGPWLSRKQLVSREHVVFCTPSTVTSRMIAGLLPQYRQVSDRTWVFNPTTSAPRPVSPNTRVYATLEGAVWLGPTGNHESVPRIAFDPPRRPPSPPRLSARSLFTVKVAQPEAVAVPVALVREVNVHVLDRVATAEQLRHRLRALIESEKAAGTSSRRAATRPGEPPATSPRSRRSG